MIFKYDIWSKKYTLFSLEYNIILYMYINDIKINYMLIYMHDVFMYIEHISIFRISVIINDFYL